MAFVVKKIDSFSWPVKIKTPADGGGYDSQEIKLKFKKLSNSDLKKLSEDKEDFSDQRFCKAVVLGWEGVVDEEGNEIPYSQENLEQMFEIFGFAAQVVKHYYEAITGVIAKN